MTIVATRPASIAATLSPEAIADAKDLLDDRGWFHEGDATGAELLDLIDAALGMRDVYLCEACFDRITDEMARGGVAVCRDCGC